MARKSTSRKAQRAAPDAPADYLSDEIDSLILDGTLTVAEREKRIRDAFDKRGPARHFSLGREGYVDQFGKLIPIGELPEDMQKGGREWTQGAAITYLALYQNFGLGGFAWRAYSILRQTGITDYPAALLNYFDQCAAAVKSDGGVKDIAKGMGLSFKSGIGLAAAMKSTDRQKYQLEVLDRYLEIRKIQNTAAAMGSPFTLKQAREAAARELCRDGSHCTEGSLEQLDLTWRKPKRRR